MHIDYILIGNPAIHLKNKTWLFLVLALFGFSSSGFAMKNVGLPKVSSMGPDSCSAVPGVHCRSKNLSGIQWQGKDLSKGRFSRSLFEGANLKQANLFAADLRFANLRNADLRYADLRHANLEGAIITGAIFDGADLSYANLRNVNSEANVVPCTKPPALAGLEVVSGPLEGKKAEDLWAAATDVVIRNGRISTAVLQRDLGVTYERAEEIIKKINQKGLRVLSLSGEIRLEKPPSFVATTMVRTFVGGAKIQEANFSGADMREMLAKHALLDFSNFSNALMGSADLTEASLSCARLENTRGNDLKLVNSVLMGANMRGANLNRADFRGANLRYVYGPRSVFEGASFRKADLRGSLFFESSFTHANFDQAKMQQSEGMDGADYSFSDFSGASFNRASMMGTIYSKARFDNAIWVDGEKCLSNSIGRCVASNK